MHIVIAGHVDHGKSTVIGRLLADTGSLPEGKLDQVKERCLRNSKPFEYAFLLDALKDEQAQGITIDAARVFFKTPKREYLILDAPGHIEFLKNMVTGASHAEAALLVIDAKEGVQENSRRHGYMLSMLGISQIAVLVNKMDLVGYDRAVFERIRDEYGAFLAEIDVRPEAFLPLSGMAGDNVANGKGRLTWFDGPNVLEVLDDFEEAPPPVGRPFRMPVQDVYKFTNAGDDRRIVAGTVETGRLRPGEELVFYPSGKRSRVRSIESFAHDGVERAEAGEATGFTLTEQIYVTRGELAGKEGEVRPDVSTRLRASLFWLGREPMVVGKEYGLRLGTVKVPMRLESIERVLDASSLSEDETKQRIDRHEVAEVVLRTRRAVAFDKTDVLPLTSRFVVVDDYDIKGGGIVLESLEDSQTRVRDQVFLRENRWEKSLVGAEHRAERYNQKATLLLVTGPARSPRKEIAKALERRLFEEGKLVYFLAFGSVRYGVDADITRSDAPRSEPELMRRLGEVAHILVDAGLILVVSAQALSTEDLEVFKTTVDPERILVAWAGEPGPEGLPVDLDLGAAPEAEAVDRLKALLQERGAIFRPW